MQQRRSANGRPSGTDGSDFSYRMVVDSRYTKVAQGKSRLSAVIFIQAIIQLLGALSIHASAAAHEFSNKLAVSSSIICFISLLSGELGRKRSRTLFLKFYVFGSSIAVLLLVAYLAVSNIFLETIQNLSGWRSKKFEIITIAAILLGLLVQIIAIKTATSLVHNMAPPKRAS